MRYCILNYGVRLLVSLTRYVLYLVDIMLLLKTKRYIATYN